MRATAPSSTREPAAAPTLAELLQRARYEVFPLPGVEEDVAEYVPRDVKVTVTSSPRRGIESTLRLTEELARRGFPVIPHISARLVRDEGHLREILGRLREIDAREAFVIAGDAERPVGEYADAAALLAAMAEVGHGLEEIGIAGYPESHPFISDEATIQAMYDKQPFATYVVSQLCFDASVIASWIDRVHARGVDLPVYVGMPGRVPRTKLLRIARRIGVGESARFLGKHANRVARLLLPRGYSPDGLVGDLAPHAADPAKRIAGLHVYTFNEVAKTEEWRRKTIERLESAP